MMMHFRGRPASVEFTLPSWELLKKKLKTISGSSKGSMEKYIITCSDHSSNPTPLNATL